MYNQRERRPLKKSVLVGLLIVTLGLLITQAIVRHVGEALSMSMAMLAELFGSWVITGLLLALVLYWERRPLSSIGFSHPSLKTLGWGFGAFFVGILTFGVTTPLVEAFGLGSTVEGVTWLGQFPIWILVVIAITAGVTEEIMFRGYLLERVGELTGAIWVGALFSAIVFTLLHIALWGIGGAIQIGAWTIVITVLYMKTRNLWACIFMHPLNDLYAFVLVPLLFF